MAPRPTSNTGFPQEHTKSSKKYRKRVPKSKVTSHDTDSQNGRKSQRSSPKPQRNLDQDKKISHQSLPVLQGSEEDGALSRVSQAHKIDSTSIDEGSHSSHIPSKRPHGTEEQQPHDAKRQKIDPQSLGSSISSTELEGNEEDLNPQSGAYDVSDVVAQHGTVPGTLTSSMRTRLRPRKPKGPKKGLIPEASYPKTSKTPLETPVPPPKRARARSRKKNISPDTLGHQGFCKDMDSDEIPPRASLMGMPKDVREQILGHCVKNYHLEEWKANPSCEGELLQSFPEHEAQRNEVQILRVNRQLSAEFKMLLYETLSIVISGQDVVYDNIPLPREEHLDPQGRPWATNPLRGIISDRMVMIDLLNLKVSLTTAKSLSFPDFLASPMFQYIRHLRLTIDAKQYEGDSIFPSGRGIDRDEHIPIQQQQLFDGQGQVSRFAAAESRGRVQGRSSFHVNLMGKLAGFLCNTRPNLQSLHIDFGRGLKTLEWQKPGFRAKTGFIPAGKYREAHLSETVESMIMWSSVRPQLSPRMVQELEEIALSEKNSRISYINPQTSVSYPADAHIDYRTLFEEIYRDALRPGPGLRPEYIQSRRAGENRDLNDLGPSLDKLLLSLLPFPPADCDVAYKMNVWHELNPHVYHDVVIIKQLIKQTNNPNLALISQFFHRVNCEIEMRVEDIRRAEKNLSQQSGRDVVLLNQFFLSFSHRQLDDYKPSEGDRLADSSNFNRFSASRLLLSQYGDDPEAGGPWQKTYDDLKTELDNHWRVIEKGFRKIGSEFWWIIITIPDIKDSNPTKESDTSASEKEPNKRLTPEIGASRDVEHLQDDDTMRLDAEIRSAVARGDTFQAYHLFNVLKNSSYFRPHRLPQRDVPDIPVLPWNPTPDTRSQEEIEADSLVKARRLASEQRGGTKRRVLRIPATVLAKALEEIKRGEAEDSQRYARLREVGRMELVKAGYGKDINQGDGIPSQLHEPLSESGIHSQPLESPEHDQRETVSQEKESVKETLLEEDGRVLSDKEEGQDLRMKEAPKKDDKVVAALNTEIPLSESRIDSNSLESSEHDQGETVSQKKESVKETLLEKNGRVLSDKEEGQDLTMKEAPKKDDKVVAALNTEMDALYITWLPDNHDPLAARLAAGNSVSTLFSPPAPLPLTGTYPRVPSTSGSSASSKQPMAMAPPPSMAPSSTAGSECPKTSDHITKPSTAVEEVIARKRAAISENKAKVAELQKKIEEDELELKELESLDTESVENAEVGGLHEDMALGGSNE